uniref:Uncharacterized protein n=1 Tax=Anguilla anguilla TaxID=7936 RepID=A0A0E9XLR9_ANGAN
MCVCVCVCVSVLSVGVVSESNQEDGLHLCSHWGSFFSPPFEGLLPAG